MYQKYVKRLTDVSLSIVIIVISLPFGIFIIILIKLFTKGPIIFCQERTGLKGKNFKMYKLRTMTDSNNVMDLTIENQITPIGKMIKFLSLDEIPQVINIIKGEMSFIGPRPWITEYYSYMTDEQRQRVSVLPGITGLAQVHGRNNLSILEKLEYDLGYARRISLREDAKIVFLTVITIFKRSGSEIKKLGIHKELSLLKNQQRYEKNL